MILEQPGAAGGAHTFGAEEVLDRDGNAMQRTAAFAARQFLVGLFGALAGSLGDHELHGVGGGIEPLDALERGGGQLRGRYFAPAQGGSGFEQRHSASSAAAGMAAWKAMAGSVSGGRARARGRKSASRGSSDCAMRSSLMCRSGQINRNTYFMASSTRPARIATGATRAGGMRRFGKIQ